MVREEPPEANITGNIPVNESKFTDLHNIDGKTPLIIRKTYIFPNFSGVFPFIFQRQVNQRFIW